MFGVILLKNELKKIIFGGIFLIAAIALEKIFSINRYFSLALYLIPYIILGYDVLLSAFKKILKGKALDESFLMTVATIGAFFLGEYPEAVSIILFFKVGELFEDFATDKSKSSISELMQLKADYANLVVDNQTKRISPSEIKKGDILSVFAGEKFPTDAVIIKGTSSVDTSSLTGEKMPVDVSPNDEILGGYINLTGSVLIKALNDYNETAVSKITELTQKAAKSKSKSERFINRFSKIYTPVVVIFAVLLALIPSLITKNSSVWINRALIFLVVSCPCALVVSVPLCFFTGMGKASKKGILIKGGEYIERLAACKTFIFDKTGTLTKGVFKAVAVHPENHSKMDLLELAAYSESESSHPIAKAVVEEYSGFIDKRRINEIREIPGKGVIANIDGKTIISGNASLMEENNINYHHCHIDGSIIHIAADGEYFGHIVISDKIKDNAKEAISRLKNSGINKTVMLTGDNEKNAKEVSKSLGIDEYYSNLLPDKKLEIEQRIKKESSSFCAYVGDGINDAPVLSFSDIGISMGNIGSDCAIEASDAVICDDDLFRLADAVEISIRTVKKSYFIIAFVLLVKFGVLILGALGLAGMWAAVFSDVGSLIAAVLISAAN